MKSIYPLTFQPSASWKECVFCLSMKYGAYGCKNYWLIRPGERGGGSPPFLTPALNQKFSATPKIWLKLCSISKIVDFTTFFLKCLIKFLNFHFEVAQNRGVLIFLGGSSRFGPLQYWVEQFSPPPFSGPLAGPVDDTNKPYHIKPDQTKPNQI